MKKKLFAELMESMNEALEHAKGKRELRTTVLPESPRSMSAKEVRRMRERLRASQAVFARFLNVSTQLVRAWESDRRQPDGAALKLLAVAQEYPPAVFAGLATPRTYESPTGDAARVRESTAPYKGGSKVSRGSSAKVKQRPARQKRPFSRTGAPPTGLIAPRNASASRRAGSCAKRSPSTPREPPA